MITLIKMVSRSTRVKQRLKNKDEHGDILWKAEKLMG